jgi:hypothetical protein
VRTYKSSYALFKLLLSHIRAYKSSYTYTDLLITHTSIQVFTYIYWHVHNPCEDISLHTLTHLLHIRKSNASYADLFIRCAITQVFTYIYWLVYYLCKHISLHTLTCSYTSCFFQRGLCFDTLVRTCSITFLHMLNHVHMFHSCMHTKRLHLFSFTHTDTFCIYQESHLTHADIHLKNCIRNSNLAA